MDKMNDTLDQQVRQSKQRAMQYWYEDGFSEIMLGILFLLIALFFGVMARLPADSGWRAAFALLLPVLIVGGVYGLRWGGRRLKERYTYPRTGYVAYRRRQTKSRRALRAVAGGAMGALVGILFAASPASQAWIPAVQGILVGGLFFYLAMRLELARFYGLALLSVLLGVASSLLIGAPNWGNAAYYGAMSASFLGSGLWTLRVYLRHTTSAQEG